MIQIDVNDVMDRLAFILFHFARFVVARHTNEKKTKKKYFYRVVNDPHRVSSIRLAINAHKR